MYTKGGMDEHGLGGGGGRKRTRTLVLMKRLEEPRKGSIDIG